MSRWLAVFAIVALSAGTARADGFVKLGFGIAANPAPAGAAAAPAAAAAIAATTATPMTVPRIGVALFPTKARARSSRPDLVYVPSTPIEIPRRNGGSLGDDRDWRVQAAQVGVMAGAFAALVALCGDGACMW